MTVLEKKERQLLALLTKSAKIASYGGLDHGLYWARTKDDFVFVIDLAHPGEIDRVRKTLAERNKLGQYILGRRLTPILLARTTGNIISRPLLHAIKAGTIRITERVREILEDHTGYSF
jgi:hypothetical protein